ncbi:MAG TPA: AAA family ATPase, partial [Bacteroidia bacterium]|nr:AAA family ATPase [Bacteroidia bacterium]
GSLNDLINKKCSGQTELSFEFIFDDINIAGIYKIDLDKEGNKFITDVKSGNKRFAAELKNSDNITDGKGSFGLNHSKEYKTFILNHSRLFFQKETLVKQKIVSDTKLSLDAGNLEKVLGRLLKNETTRAEIIEWLQLLIPEFEKIEIIPGELSGIDNMLIYERGTNKPFTKNLISDGTFNILSILAAVYQKDESQFISIEEPENGLNPKVIKELVNLFRQKCKEGHFIWLNTHSQTLVSELTTEEIILVDKKNGETIAKQIKGMNLHGLKMDEALLTNALGGGIPW